MKNENIHRRNYPTFPFFRLIVQNFPKITHYAGNGLTSRHNSGNVVDSLVCVLMQGEAWRVYAFSNSLH